MTAELYSIFIIAFGLGLVHAMDADHIAAVSVLSAEKHTTFKSVGFALQWSSAHALVILLMSFVLYFLGESLPQQISAFAEQLVGVMLISLGVFMVYRMQRYRIGFSFHSHDGYRPHAHWYSANDTNQSTHKHKAALVGGLHGMAGSAPLLATLPLVKSANLPEIITMVSIFSVGVFVAMLSFGGALAFSMKKIINKGENYLRIFQIILAVLSIGIGVKLVSS